MIHKWLLVNWRKKKNDAYSSELYKPCGWIETQQYLIQYEFGNGENNRAEMGRTDSKN